MGGPPINLSSGGFVLPSYLTPGVYVEEVTFSSAIPFCRSDRCRCLRRLHREGTDDDPNDPEGVKPRLVTSWTQFENLYGGFVAGSMLPLSVYGYFNNGGSLAYIVRVPNTGRRPNPASSRSPAGDRRSDRRVEFTTVEPNADVTVDITLRPHRPTPTTTPADVRAHDHRGP